MTSCSFDSVFALLSLAVCVSPLAAAEVHVAPIGDDANDGSAAAPLDSLEKAAYKLQPGDVWRFIVRRR